MKKKYLYLILLLLSTIKGVAQSADSVFTIKGHISEMEKGTIFFSYPIRGKTVVDSGKVVNGNFEFEGTIHEPAMGYLRLTNTTYIDSAALFLFLEPSAITVELKYKPFTTVKVEGSKTHHDILEWKNDNKLLKAKYAYALNNVQTEKQPDKKKLLEDTLMMYDSEKHLLEYNFIKNHPQSFAIVVLLWTDYRFYTLPELTGIYTEMNYNLQNTQYGKALLKHINELASSSYNGIAPNIAVKDFITNKDFNLSDARGKYVLMDFWGSWCVPCLALIPSIVDEHQKYKDKNIVFVSIADDQPQNQDKCREIIHKYNMNWVNLWQNEKAQDKNSIISHYQVQAYPTILLIDPNGKIIERGEGAEGYLKCKSALEKIF